MLSTWGLGSLLGMALAAILPRPNAKYMGSVLLGLISIMGIGLALLGLAKSTLIASIIALVLGALNGYINIFFMTWVQSRAPQAFIGRLMSLLMFASTGLFPISMALSGALSRTNITGLLIGAGAIVTVIALALTLNPTVRAMEPAAQTGD
jgi:hypothetical protein